MTAKKGQHVDVRPQWYEIGGCGGRRSWAQELPHGVLIVVEGVGITFVPGCRLMVTDLGTWTSIVVRLPSRTDMNLGNVTPEEWRLENPPKRARKKRA